MLIKLALKNIKSKPGRFLLTSLAVLVGVALTTAVFVFTDSLRETFGGLSDDIESGYDLAIRSEVPFGDRLNAAPVPLAVADAVEGIDGVAGIQPRVIDFSVVPNGPDGEAVRSNAGPVIAVNWESQALEPRLFLAEGAPPAAPDEFALDIDAAEEDGFVIGDRYDVQTPLGIREFTLTGTFTFADPEENAIVGGKLVAFETATAVELVNGGLGYDDITISLAPEASEDGVSEAIAATLPDGLEVLPREAIAEEQAEDFNEFIDIFRTVLLVFAFVILLVAAFIIYNVFSIIVGQRIQEIGLLRALGATGKQITQSIAVEALGVGIFATIAGVLLGLPIAWLLQTALAAADFGPDQVSTPLRPTTIVVAAILGIGLTLAAAVWPALRARSVSPMAALRSDVSHDHEVARSPLLGALLAIAGVAMVVLGFALDEYLWLLILTVAAGIFLYAGLSRINLLLGRLSLVGLAVALLVAALTLDLRASMLLALLGAAALIAFLGMNLLSPLFASPVTRVIGAPFANFLGIPSRLARENAGRSPDRTATAASALMIGLALVTTVAVVADSFKATFADVLRDAVASDWVVLGEDQGPQIIGFSNTVAADLDALPEISDTLAIQFNEDLFRTDDNDSRSAYSANLEDVATHFDAEILDSDPSLNGPSAVWIHEDPAEDLGVGVGDTVPVEFTNGVRQDFVVAAVFGNLAIFDSGWVVDTGVFELNPALVEPGDAFVSLIQAEGVTETEARTEIDKVVEDFSQLTAQTKDEFQADAEESINQVLVVITVLLAVSIILAVLGVAITLALSVFERTREIGLTRAVGATRKQMKRAVRVEGVIVALFGGFLGIGLGLIFGFAAVQIIPDDFVSQVAIPWGSLLTYLIVAGVAGVFAAFFPARRAAKLNVLDAISQG